MNQTIENLSLKAWSAFETINYDGWLLRFADGYTKRVNSVTVLDNVESNLADRIAYCESQYRSRQQKPIFRLLSFNNPDKLDLELADRGYQLADPTFVVGLELSTLARSPNSIMKIHSENLDDWLNFYYNHFNINPSDQKKPHVHRKILAAIESETIFASLKLSKAVLGGAIGILESGYLGIFDVFINPAYRRCGFATNIMQNLLQWGSDRGASFSYLQVAKTNIFACALYEKFGYQPLYEYWYRVGSE